MITKSNIARNGLVFLISVITTQSSAVHRLEGRVIDADTRHPLDSVRVTALSASSAAWTKKNGTFSLVSFDRNPSDSVKPHFRQRGAATKTLLPVEPPPQKITLMNIQGRSIKTFPAFDQSITGYLTAHPGGVYLLSGTTIRRKVIVVTNPFTLLSVDNNRQSISVLPSSPPPASSGSLRTDIAFFCKEGYTSASISFSEDAGKSTVALSKKRWVASDIHNHTVLTDGDEKLDDLLSNAFNRYNLDILVNSEHGGENSRDTAGISFGDDTLLYEQLPHEQNSISIPRWYTLSYFSWPKVLNQRKLYPDNTVLQGVEWNCPGHNHASVGFINDADQPDAIYQFEYMFDQGDNDLHRPDLTKQNQTHENALTALQWMKEHYPTSSYCFLNHPSRGSSEYYRINHIRDFIAVAPEICLGFEGMPGHHRANYRGNYDGENENLTWGGADPFLAHIGGVWDALLGEGHHFRIIVDSDFHRTDQDFWPGEYTKTWSAAADTGAQAWLNGMRSGELFITLGDLISELDFYLDDSVTCAGMGNDMHTTKRNLSVVIRFKSPPVNSNMDSVKVDHIDLIGGFITGKVSPDDREYTRTTNASTRVYQRFNKNDWVVHNGWNTIRYAVSVATPTYFRLRATNLPVGYPDEVDDNGDPMVDKPGENTPEIAWNDLWFYSNPIFVYPEK